MASENSMHPEQGLLLYAHCVAVLTEHIAIVLEITAELRTMQPACQQS